MIRMFLTLLTVAAWISLGSAHAATVDCCDRTIEEWKDLAYQSPSVTRDEALACFEQQALQGASTAVPAYALGLTEFLLGRHLASLDWYQFALDSEHPASLEAAIWNNMGINWEILNYPDSARAAYRASRECELRLGNEFGAWQTAVNEALQWALEGRNDEADSLLLLSKAHFERVQDDRNLAHVYMNLAITDRNRDRVERAMQFDDEAFARFASVGDSLGVLHALAARLDLLSIRGAYDEVASVFEAVDRWEPEFTPGALRVFFAVERMHQALRMGDLAAVQRMLDAAMRSSELDWGVKEGLELMRVAADLSHEKGDAGQIQGYINLFDSAFQRLQQVQRSEQLADLKVLGEQRQLRHEVDHLRRGLLVSQRTNALLGGLMALLVVLFVVAVRMKRQGSFARRTMFRLLKDQVHDASAGQPPRVTAENQGKESRLRTVHEALVALMSEERSYLDPQLTVGQTAALLKTNTTYLSQALQQERQIGFSDYVNSLRIRDARTLMLSEENLGLSFDQIASQCGFSNTRTFYRQFQSFTNMTPGQFRSMVMEQARRNGNEPDRS